jgi:hypothetical protein
LAVSSISLAISSRERIWGSLSRSAGARDVELRLRALERGVVEEAQSADRDVAAAPGELALAHQVQQVALHLVLLDAVGTASVELGHRRHRGQIGLACALREAAQHHVLVHLFAQCTHVCLRHRIAGTFPRDDADTAHACLQQTCCGLRLPPISECSTGR